MEKEGFRDHDRIVELLIEWGVFESAVADALAPDFDSEGPLLRRLRQASLLIGHLFCLSVRKKRSEMLPSRYDQLVRALHDPLFSHLPPKIALRVPEGYAYYGLYPETYLESALRFVQEVGPRPAVCIGSGASAPASPRSWPPPSKPTVLRSALTRSGRAGIRSTDSSASLPPLKKSCPEEGVLFSHHR